jgi:hypothetical protein
MYAHIFKISAHIKTFASNQIYAHILKNLRIPQNIRIHQNIRAIRAIKILTPLKYLRIYKIDAPQQECSRLIIYDSNKAAVEIFAAYERCMRPKI